MSFKSAIPVINETTIKGTAINLSALMKMVPNGFIQSDTKTLKPKLFITTPKTIPSIIPINIFQCRANFILIVGTLIERPTTNIN